MFSSYAPVFLPECQSRALGILLGQGWKERESSPSQRKDLKPSASKVGFAPFSLDILPHSQGLEGWEDLKLGVWSMTLADNEMPSLDNWNEIVVLAATGMSQYQAKWMKPYTRGEYCTSLFIWSVHYTETKHRLVFSGREKWEWLQMGFGGQWKCSNTELWWLYKSVNLLRCIEFTVEMNGSYATRCQQNYF